VSSLDRVQDFNGISFDEDGFPLLDHFQEKTVNLIVKSCTELTKFDSESVKAFLKNVMFKCHSRKMMHLAVVVAIRLLTGPAIDWYLSLEFPYQMAWPEFETALKQRFAAEPSVEEKLLKLYFILVWFHSVAMLSANIRVLLKLHILNSTNYLPKMQIFLEIIFSA
jgi:hypothetical protein